MPHALEVDFFPQHANLCRAVSVHSRLRHNGVAAGLLEHGVELRSAKIQCAAIMTALKMSKPYMKRCALQFLPCECAEPIWTGEGLNVLASRGQVLNGRGHGLHQAAR